MWHIRTTSDNPVVLDELKKYRLTSKRFISHYNKFGNGILPVEGGDSFVLADLTCCFFYNTRHDDRDNQREREYARHEII